MDTTKTPAKTYERRFFTVRVWAPGLGATGKQLVMKCPYGSAVGLGETLARACAMGAIERFSIAASTPAQIARSRDTAQRWSDAVRSLEVKLGTELNV